MEPVKPDSLPAEVQEQLRTRSAEDQRQAERLWRLLGDADVEPADVPSTDAAWAELAHRLDAASAKPLRMARTPDRLPRRRRPPPRLAWIAGSLAALALLIGLGAWMRPVSVAVPPGQTLTVALPDGSDVQLNSGSRLRYRRHFARWPFLPAARRLVSLRGEAFFDVQPDGRPFVVETFNARVEVLGTRFNVQAWPESRTSATRVTLAEGKVRAAPRDASGQGVVLSESGQMIQIERADQAGPPAVQRVPIEQALAWRRGGFAVLNQPLSVILREVERTFAVSISLENGLALSDSMTLIYQEGTKPETVIHDICLAQGWRYRRTSQGFALSDDPARP